MFGKGVYFADCFSKSFNYTNCFAAGGEMAQHQVTIAEGVNVKVFQLNPREMAPESEILLAVEPEDIVLLCD